MALISKPHFIFITSIERTLQLTTHTQVVAGREIRDFANTCAVLAFENSGSAGEAQKA